MYIGKNRREKILVIDDDPNFRESLTDILVESGYNRIVARAMVTGHSDMSLAIRSLNSARMATSQNQ